MPTMFFFWGFGEVQQVLVGIGIGWLELLGAELGQLVDGGGEGGEVHGVVPGHLLGVELELERGVGVDVHEVGDGASIGRLHDHVLHLHVRSGNRVLWSIFQRSVDCNYAAYATIVVLN